MNGKREGNIRRLAVDALPPEGGVIRLSAAAARHARALRLRKETRIELYDGRGNRARARVVSMRDGLVVCRAEPCRAVAPRTRRVVLVQALPKGDKLASIVRICAELGVRAVHLAISERSVPRPAERRSVGRCERLVRVAKEAAAQSGQACRPEIIAPAALSEVAARAPETARRVVFWEGSGQKLDQALFGPQPPSLKAEEEVWVVVGPEGGLTDSEIADLRDLGYRDATLGPSLLRVETAAPLAIGLVLDRLGQLCATNL